MYRWIALALAALALLPAAVLAETPVATPMPVPTAAERASCAEMDAYAVTLRDVADDEVLAELDALEDAGSVLDMRPSQMKALSLVTDTIATRMDAIPESDIPLIARDYHDATVRLFSQFSGMFNAMATSGPMAMMLYVDSLDATIADLDAGKAWILHVCGEAPPALFGD